MQTPPNPTTLGGITPLSCPPPRMLKLLEHQAVWLLGKLEIGKFLQTFFLCLIQEETMLRKGGRGGARGSGVLIYTGLTARTIPKMDCMWQGLRLSLCPTSVSLLFLHLFYFPPASPFFLIPSSVSPLHPSPLPPPVLTCKNRCHGPRVSFDSSLQAPLRSS